MLNALTRIFQSSSSGSDPSSPYKGKQTGDLTPPPLILPDGEPMSRKPSSLLIDRVRRDHPSQVAWISPSSLNASGSFTNRSAGKQTDNSPLPSPIEPSTTRPRLLGSRKPSLKRLSSGSLKLQSVYLSEHSETSSVASALPTKPLSPIQEQHAYAPARRHPSLDSVPKTPDSAGAFSLSSHPFLTRTLKRTSSQASTSTVASAAPSIPPLDLRPPFMLGLPPRRSHLAQPSLPTVASSPRPNVSVIYEGSSNRSFMTAASIDESEMDVTEGEPRVSQFRETYFNSTIGDSRSSLTEHDDDADDGQELYFHHDHDEPTSVMLEIDLGVPPPSSTLVDRFSRDATTCLNATPRGNISEHSFETSTTSTAVVETRIHNRWLKGLSFGSVSFAKPGGGEHKQEVRPATAAFVLFWVGFIAPWCWLIGGWYLSRSGEMVPDGQYLSTVSLMWPRGDFADDIELGPKAQAQAPSIESTGVTGTGWRSRLAVWAFWHHPSGKHSSKEVLPLSVKDHMHFPHGNGGSVEVLDPWVKRCRVAAIVSGAMLLLALVVTLIIVFGVRH
ncbi:hypothetical protein EUX98_g5206 [Antrodiella citrinella]|uniref:Uncharacterized protein n=1 Tax=Antrodiella citrinella TaxID=2447956 RepID=A0A4S4MUJ8_9APHY|nr:hypothetical protein EUX98_g5206 [Antrodiella citrinella]